MRTKIFKTAAIALSSSAPDKKENISKGKIIKSDVHRVRIRVWMMSARSASVGHTSLQTFAGGSDGKGIYASFWPDMCSCGGPLAKAKAYKLQLFKSVPPPTAKATIESDEYLEGRPADFVKDLYSLDVAKINHQYEKFTESGYQWSLFGSRLHLSVKDLPKISNCSGLVFSLLMSGGLEDRLVPDARTWVRLSSAKSPEAQMMTMAGQTTAIAIEHASETVAFFASLIPAVGPVLAWGIRAAPKVAVVATHIGTATAVVAKTNLVSPNDVAALVHFAHQVEGNKYDLVAPSKFSPFESVCREESIQVMKIYSPG